MTITGSTASKWEAAKSKLEAFKPVGIALAIGLVAGPLISNMAGWQVTSSTAHAQARAGLVEQQALFCEAAARAAVQDPGALDWTGRRELAEKWSIMPGLPTVDSDVASACAGKLAG